MAPKTIGLDKHISLKKNIRGGKPCLTGTRIAISNIIVWHFKLGYSVEQIAAEYDLSLTGVYAALAYYYEHKEAIDNQIEQSTAFEEQFRQKHPSKLKARLKELRGE